MTITLSYNCEINANINDVYQFHTDPNNLSLITPPWISVNLVSSPKIPVIKGEIIKLNIKQYYISFRWEIIVEQMNFPTIIVDKALKSPFKNFIHKRTFSEISNVRTRMNDTVVIELPFGYFGKFLVPFIKSDLNKMFAYRHQKTVAFFEPIKTS